jgi:hypothetical protein
MVRSGLLTRGAIAALLAIPLLAGMAVLMSTTIAERAGAIRDDRLPRNIAEAAGTRNAADLVRRLRRAEDPREVLPVRPHVLSGSVAFATAFEASIWPRDVELVKLFDREGAPLDEQTRAELACLASDLEAEVVLEYLAGDGPVDCEKNAALQRVEARRAPEQAAR